MWDADRGPVSPEKDDAGHVREEALPVPLPSHRDDLVVGADLIANPSRASPDLVIQRRRAPTVVDTPDPLVSPPRTTCG